MCLSFRIFMIELQQNHSRYNCNPESNTHYNTTQAYLAMYLILNVAKSGRGRAWESLGYFLTNQTTMKTYSSQEKDDYSSKLES